jgi:hypothetical protein
MLMKKQKTPMRGNSLLRGNSRFSAQAGWTFNPPKWNFFGENFY